MTLQARVRRLQDTLSIVGIGVIAFASWSLVKSVLLLLLYDEETQRQFYSINDSISMHDFYIAFVIIVGIDLAIRLYVGLSARAEGRGKRKGAVYLVIATILAITSVVGIAFVLLGMSSGPSLFDMFMTVVIEATSVATLVLMVFCALRLRRLNRLEE